MRDLPERLLDRAAQYRRTAAAALETGDLDAAFENARTAAELAGKAALQAKTGGYGEKHNIAAALVQAGIWPKSRSGPLAKLMGEYVRGVYSFKQPVRLKDAKDATKLAEQLAWEAERTL